MSETALIAILTTIGACIAGIFALFIKHMIDCRDHREIVAGMANDVKRMVEEIGTHETGLRGRVHKLENILTPDFIRWQREQEL